MLLSQSVSATKREGTARISIASRMGNPVPEKVDMRGHGFVDFVSDRLWTTDRLVTQRIASERKAQSGPLGRILGSLAYPLFDHAVGRKVFYQGGARWKSSRRGWRGPQGAIGDSKDVWHPLFLLDAIAASERDWSVRDTEDVGGTLFTRIDFVLTKELFDVPTWETLSHGNGQTTGASRTQEIGARETVNAVVWLDNLNRIRRMSFEAVYGDSDRLGLWLISDLANFGM